jgi:phospholipid/cholesterol/gamma-HCH transport system substrate-binding protein
MSIMTRRNAVFYSAGIKLGIFTVVSILLTGLLAVIMGNIGLGGGKTYQAVFTNASTLDKGDDVRVAGVSVGEVKEVEHHERSMAMVTFRIDDDIELTTASTAEIRFLNLVGDRYLALEQGADANAEPLQDGGRLPIEQTSPALDLTTLFNGFKPLFQALQPDQVNELTMNIVQVLQGEGGTIQGLLEHTASLTNTLADRDQLIGEVVDNLGQTLETVDSRSQQLSQLIVEFKGWMGDLARDRNVIGNSLTNISNLTVEVAELLHEGRPLLKDDIAKVRRLAGMLNQPENREQVIEIFNRLPESMTDQTRTGTYGSWYQYYVCGVSAKFTLPAELGTLPIIKDLLKQLNSYGMSSTAARCNRS